MSLRPNIKQVLAIIQKAVAQTPIDKQSLLNNKIARVVDKYQKLGGQNQDARFLKELEFNLNFIRLSFPHLDYSPPKEGADLQAAASNAEDIRARQEFIELQNKEEVLKFVKQTESALKGVRQEVEFSNWSAGNIDPQDLKRHQQLLKRQYFSGEFWKNKEKPISPTAAYLLNLMENHPEAKNEKIQVKQDTKEFSHDPEQNWEKVKR